MNLYRLEDKNKNKTDVYGQTILKLKAQTIMKAEKIFCTHLNIKPSLISKFFKITKIKKFK